MYPGSTAMSAVPPLARRERYSTIIRTRPQGGREPHFFDYIAKYPMGTPMEETPRTGTVDGAFNFSTCNPLHVLSAYLAYTSASEEADNLKVGDLGGA